jgi:hypothetical protein
MENQFIILVAIFLQCVQNATLGHIVNDVVILLADKGMLHDNHILNDVTHDFTLCLSVCCLVS